MPTTYFNPSIVGKAFESVGLLPKECADIEILMPAGGITQVRYTVNIMPEDFHLLAQAFAKMAELAEAL